MLSRIRGLLQAAFQERTLLLVPVAGYATRLRLSFLALALATGYELILRPLWFASWLAVLLASILLHELGHALVAGRWAVVHSIEIHGLGGLTRYHPILPLSAGRAVVIALAGPGAGLALGGAAWLLATVVPPPAGIVLGNLAAISTGLSLINLLPMSPLDGGRAASIALGRWFGDRGELLGAILGLLTAALTLAGAIALLDRGLVLLAAWCAACNVGPVLEAWAARSRTAWTRLDSRAQIRERY